MKTGLRLHTRNKHQRLHPFFMFLLSFVLLSLPFSIHLSLSFFLCISPSLVVFLSPTCFRVSSFHFSHSSTSPFLIHHFPALAFFQVCVWETGSQRKIDGNTVSLCICYRLFNLLNQHFVFTLRGEWVRKKNKDDKVKCGLPQEAPCWIEFVKFLSLLHYYQ